MVLGDKTDLVMGDEIGMVTILTQSSVMGFKVSTLTSALPLWAGQLHALIPYENHLRNWHRDCLTYMVRVLFSLRGMLLDGSDGQLTYLVTLGFFWLCFRGGIMLHFSVGLQLFFVTSSRKESIFTFWVRLRQFTWITVYHKTAANKHALLHLHERITVNTSRWK